MQRILIVEDDPLNLKFFRDVLQANGFEILEAKSGVEGLALARKEHPDLIVMDIQLPGMDGLTAADSLKKDENTREIPVLAISGYAIEGDREHVLARGVDGYLPKPVNIDDLLENIRQLLES